jgi:cardiolipin synthase
LYAFVGYRGFMRRRRRRKRGLPLDLKPHEPTSESNLERLQALDADKAARLAENLTHFPVVGTNVVEPFEEAFAIYGAIADAILAAKHHVHLEYYIFEADDRGESFRELLAKKAREGVECRLLVDNVGSFGLNRKFLQPMIDAGVKVAFFWPVRFTRPWGMHLRNHRKLVVVDGKVGFIGSQNIGGETLRRRGRRLTWRDTQVRIEGPGVLQLQTVFAEDWAFTTGEKLEAPAYHPTPRPLGASLVQTVPTGPDESELGLEMLLLTLVAGARQRITLTTPYFIPSGALLLSLAGAAKRGVAVDLLVPRDSDHAIVRWASRAWFRLLARSGITILEYPETFVHAKVVTIDDRIVLLGSANMDMRSFRLNFECSLLTYDEAFARRMLRSFDSMKTKSVELTAEHLEKQPFLVKVRDGACRLFSPLL